MRDNKSKKELLADISSYHNLLKVYYAFVDSLVKEYIADKLFDKYINLTILQQMIKEIVLQNSKDDCSKLAKELIADLKQYM